MKGADGGADFANAWNAFVRRVGAATLSLASFAALDVGEDGASRVCPVTRETFNAFVPWLSARARPADAAVFRFLSAGRVLDTITTGAITGDVGTCFPSMHPGIVASVAWRFVVSHARFDGGDGGGEHTPALSAHERTLLADAVAMLAHGYARPVSSSVAALLDAQTLSPEPAPAQLLGAALHWHARRSRGGGGLDAALAEGLAEELITARIMETRRYAPERLDVVDWTTLADETGTDGGFDALAARHPIELSPPQLRAGWRAALDAGARSSGVAREAAKLIALVRELGLPIGFATREADADAAVASADVRLDVEGARDVAAAAEGDAIDAALVCVVESVLLGKRSARYRKAEDVAGAAATVVHVALAATERASVESLAAARCVEALRPTLTEWRVARAAEAEAKVLDALVDAVEALVAGDAEGALRPPALLARLQAPGGLSWAAPWGATIVLTRGNVKPLLDHARATALPHFRRLVAVLALGAWTAEPVSALAAIEARLVTLLPKHAERIASAIHTRPHCAREHANRHGLSKHARCLSVFDVACEGRLPAARENAPGGLKAFGAVFARAHAAAPVLRARAASKMSTAVLVHCERLLRSHEFDPRMWVGDDCVTERLVVGFVEIDQIYQKLSKPDEATKLLSELGNIRRAKTLEGRMARGWGRRAAMAAASA